MSIVSLIKELETLSNHIHIEIFDNHIIVKGKTYEVRGKLKLLGFQWNPNKREWYYSAKELT